MVTKNIKKKDYLTFEQFKLKYLTTSSLDDKFFKDIKKILNSKILKKNKQRRIEKLSNVYLLKKAEGTYDLNPFWKNEIINVFSKELKLFKLDYEKTLEESFPRSKKSLLTVPFYRSDFVDLFVPEEVFNIIIFSFFKREVNSEDLLQLRITFVDKLSKIFREFFSSKLSNLYFDYYFKTVLLKSCSQNFNFESYITFKEKLYVKYVKRRKDFVLTWDIILLEYLKLTDYGFTKRHSLYKEKSKEFLDYLNSFNDEITALLSKFSEIVLHMCMELNVFKLINSKKATDYRRYDYISVVDLQKFQQLDGLQYLTSQMPMIVDPLDWNYLGKKGGYLLNSKNDVLELTKPLTKGSSRIRYTKYMIDAVNLIQKKVYNVNTTFFEYIKTDLFKKDLGIKTDNELYNLYIEYETVSEKLSLESMLIKKGESFSDERSLLSYYNKEKRSMTNSVVYQKASKEERAQMYKKLREELGISEVYLKLAYSEIVLKNELYKHINNFKQYLFIVSFVELFKDEDLRFVTRLDFRTRIFPVGRGLHRASGLFKYLLSSGFQEIDLNNDKMAILNLKEFIALKYKSFGSSFKKSDLYNWFEKTIDEKVVSQYYSFILDYLKLKIKLKNNINFNFLNNKSFVVVEKIIVYLEKLISESKECSLFLFGLYEYFQLLNYKKINSTFLIDVDQSSSGPMIYSLLSHDEVMATQTNALVYNNTKSDIYFHFLNKFLDVLSNEIANLLDDRGSSYLNISKLRDKGKNYKDFLLFLDKEKFNLFTRDFSKLLIMPTFYNMGGRGVLLLLRSLISDKGSYFDDLDFTNFFLSQVSNLLIKLLEETYSNTLKYQKALVDLCVILYNWRELITFFTLDGGLVSYKYIKVEEKFGKVLLNGKYKTYRYFLQTNALDIDKQESFLSEKHYLTFPPNFIHSLDGSLCRVIVTLFYKLFGEILEPLHDSFRLSYVSVWKLNLVIKYIYVYYFFPRYFFKYKLGFSINFTQIDQGVALTCSNMKLEKNSSNFQDFGLYFPIPYFNKNSVILDKLFISTFRSSVDRELFFKKGYKNIKLLTGSLTDEHVDNFIKSPFMFYY